VNGTIFKNRRIHPSRIFLALNRTKNSVRGVLVEADGTSIQATVTLESLTVDFPFVFWMPPHGDNDVR
jgi:hypothetical protein